MISSTPPHGREDLSALFDGELLGDASRFVHKRLARDVQWRQDFGTWQLVGDVLRGHATAAAPAGFADRVQLALAHESAAAMSSPSRSSRRGWVGGAALAASVAIAAWFVASPPDRVSPANPPAAALATAAPPPRAAAQPSAAVTAADAASPEVARPSRGQGERVAVSDSGPSAVVATAVPASAAGQTLASVPAASADLGGIDAAALVDPFQLPPPRVATRPWPRAVLPNHPATGALTASYGVRPQNPDVVASGSPGFYPFEPRLPPDADAASDAQWP